MVNVNLKLKLLDFFIVSDAELIEGAQWGEKSKYFTYASTLECDILNLPSSNASNGSTSTHLIGDGSERSHLQFLAAQLEIVRKQHHRFSPVLKIQSLFRGVLVRRTIRVYHQAAVAIQNAWRKYRARKLVKLEEERVRLGASPSNVALSSQHEPFSSTSPPSNPLATNPLASLAAHTIFLVHTSDVAVSLFMQLVRRVEQAEGIVAPDLCDANMLLLSTPNIHDDYPLVRRIFPAPASNSSSSSLTSGPRSSLNHEVGVGCRLLPGRHCPEYIRRSLQVIKPRPTGCVMNEHERFLLNKRIGQWSYRNRFLQFQSPGSRFHQLLIRAVHKYNIEMGNYNPDTEDAADGDDPAASQLPSLDPSTTDLLERETYQYQLQLGGRTQIPRNLNKVIIYPGTTICVIAAAVTIQSAYRSYRTRKSIDPCLGRQVIVQRAVRCIGRWWRACLFRLRMHLLTGLKRYGDSINSRHLFCRGDILTLLRVSPNAYVHKEFLPEHRSIFGIEPKEEDESYLRRMNQRGFDTHGQFDSEPVGKLTLIVDRNSPRRFYPFPHWLGKHWHHQPLPVVHGFTDTGIRVDLSSRLTELVKEGVNISVLPDVSQPTLLDHHAAAAATAGRNGHADDQYGWTSTNFIKLTFASIEEARTRALILALNTWLPSFHLLRPSRLRALGPFTSATPASQLAGAEMAFLMTPQHMTLCLQYQQAGGPSGPSGERHILYTTFWTVSEH